jgi:hypothetical protein
VIKSILLSGLLAMTLIFTIFQTISAISISSSRTDIPVYTDDTKQTEKNLLILKPHITTTDTIPHQVNGTYRGLWVWNKEIVTDDAAEQEFFIFARLTNLQGVYLYSFDLLPDNTGELANFVAKADSNGIEIELLAGDPSWALTPTHSVALGFTQQAISFTQTIIGDARPTGIHFDVEPYLLTEWSSDRSSTIDQYLDLLGSVKQELTISSANLTFTVDIPFWFDTITATYKSKTQPLNQHVQDITDRVVIMDYRDFAQGIDGIIYHAQNEMDYSQSISKEVVIGVETNKIEPEKITFFEEGEAVMENELTLVEQHYQINSVFSGFAIHDYLGYRALAPIKNLYLPVVLKVSLGSDR